MAGKPWEPARDCTGHPPVDEGAPDEVEDTGRHRLTDTARHRLRADPRPSPHPRPPAEQDGQPS